MEYLKITDVAEQWGISPRRLQTLCAAGKVEGAMRFGKAWMIPKDTAKPADGRTKEGKQQVKQPKEEMPLPRKTPFLHMTDLYSSADGAEKSIDALWENQEAQTLLKAGIAYSKGEIEEVYALSYHLLQRKSGFYAVVSAGMLLALCAIWRGDIHLWRQAKIHIAEAPAKNDTDRDIIAFSITAIDSMLYNVSDFPDWFTIGRFDKLHKDSLPAAKVFYAKFLYAAGYAMAIKEYKVEGVQGMALMNMVPYTVEPMISQAMADGSTIAEIYLRLTCAAVYLTGGNETQAVYHIDKALVLALPDKLYGLLAEYCRTLGFVLEQRLAVADPEALGKVRALYSIYNEGWSKLSGNVRGRTLITTLSRREREVAKLAAFGMRNAEIAEKLHMSLSSVKQTIRIVSEKTGANRNEFAAFL